MSRLAVVATLVGCSLKTDGLGVDLPFDDAALDTTVVSADTLAPVDSGIDGGLEGGPEEDSTTIEDSATGTDTREDTRADIRPDVVADTIDAAPPCTGKTFGGHCYTTLSARSMDEAVAACLAAGAHVVTVTSDAEHDFLKTVGTGDRWIGLRSPFPSNNRADYVWITGEAKTVSHWYMADPDAMGPCVAMHGSLQQWVDRTCVGPYPAICEREF